MTEWVGDGEVVTTENSRWKHHLQ